MQNQSTIPKIEWLLFPQNEKLDDYENLLNKAGGIEEYDTKYVQIFSNWMSLYSEYLLALCGFCVKILLKLGYTFLELY